MAEANLQSMVFSAALTPRQMGIAKLRVAALLLSINKNLLIEVRRRSLAHVTAEVIDIRIEVRIVGLEGFAWLVFDLQLCELL